MNKRPYTQDLFATSLLACFIAQAAIINIPIATAQTSTEACPTITLLLKKGMKNNQVMLLQKFLAQKKYLAASNVIGTFGPLTETAVKKFQAANGLEAVGYTGPKTRELIRKCGIASGNTTITPTTTGTSNKPVTSTSNTQSAGGQSIYYPSNNTSYSGSSGGGSSIVTTPSSGSGSTVGGTPTAPVTPTVTTPVTSTTTVSVPVIPSISVAKVEIPDPTYPSLPAGSANRIVYISDGDTYAATNPTENGGAITSLIRHGFEYVVNDPPTTPQYRRGGSFQGSFFFNSPLDPTGSYRTYYNDCNNPLETGGVADFTTQFKGLTSPTDLYSPSLTVMQTTAQLAYYVDPNAPTDWVDSVDYTSSGTGNACYIGKINNPQFTLRNNAALSNVFLGKTVTLANIGTAANPISIPGTLAVDMVMKTTQAAAYSGLHPAFASFPSSLSNLNAYDPKTKTLSTPPNAYGRNPVIAHSADGTRALGIYTPQIALEGEVSGGDNGYLRTPFDTGLNTMMPYIRYDYMPAGQYKFKSYYIVGTLNEVKSAMDTLYKHFKVLDPRVFEWKYYVSQNNLGSMSEDQARLHWITTGIKQGLVASPSFSIKLYLSSNLNLNAQFGLNYYAALLDYLK